MAANIINVQEQTIILALDGSEESEKAVRCNILHGFTVVVATCWDKSQTSLLLCYCFDWLNVTADFRYCL